MLRRARASHPHLVGRSPPRSLADEVECLADFHQQLGPLWAQQGVMQVPDERVCVSLLVKSRLPTAGLPNLKGRSELAYRSASKRSGTATCSTLSPALQSV